MSDIWEALLKSKDQIALIIDDYGSFQGRITLEDIIETILGMEIIDESDTVTDMQQFARERWLKRKNQYKQIELPDDETPLQNSNPHQSEASVSPDTKV